MREKSNGETVQNFMFLDENSSTSKDEWLARMLLEWIRVKQLKFLGIL